MGLVKGFLPVGMRRRNSLRLKDKVCIVTGSGMGIGRAMATLFAKEGAKVIVADISAKDGEETVMLIKERGAMPPL